MLDVFTKNKFYSSLENSGHQQFYNKKWKNILEQLNCCFNCFKALTILIAMKTPFRKFRSWLEKILLLAQGHLKWQMPVFQRFIRVPRLSFNLYFESKIWALTIRRNSNSRNSSYIWVMLFQNIRMTKWRSWMNMKMLIFYADGGFCVGFSCVKKVS